MRQYEQTHPWINFRLDLRRLSHRLWLMFGEAESKCQHIAGVPLRPETAERLHQIYLSKGIHGTTSIEGNTLSENEVLARVQGELPLPPSREYLGREIDNIVAACNSIVGDVTAGRPLELTPERIAHFNEQILDGLPHDDDVVPGKVREHSVGVARYRGAPAEDCDYLLRRLCEWLNSLDRNGEDSIELRYTFAVLKAILAHLYIAWIHPFGDGNGRTARLIEFQLMVQAGIPLPAAHLLSDHYNMTRDAYYRELDRTSKGDFPIEGFISYAMQGFVDELRQQLTVVREEQMEVTWQNHVHGQCQEETPAKRRQKHLVLDMPREAVPVSKLRSVSVRIAEEYAGKTSKTVTRDVNALVSMGLLRRVPRGVIANRRSILAFLPVVAD